MAPQQARHSLGRGKDTHMLEAPQNGIGVSHMVAVVVSEYYALYSGRIHTVGRQLGKNGVVVDSGIDQDSARRSTHIGAVTAAAAAERHKAEPLGHGEHVVAHRYKL